MRVRVCIYIYVLKKNNFLFENYLENFILIKNYVFIFYAL